MARAALRGADRSAPGGKRAVPAHRGGPRHLRQGDLYGNYQGGWTGRYAGCSGVGWYLYIQLFYEHGRRERTTDEKPLRYEPWNIGASSGVPNLLVARLPSTCSAVALR